VLVRVLYIIDSLAPAGAERSLVSMASHYVRRGVDLDVAFVVPRDGLERELRTAGVAVHSLAGTGGVIGAIRRARSLVGSSRPDLVHTTLYAANQIGRLAARLGRRPVVSSLVNTPFGALQLDDPQLRPWRARSALAVDVATSRLVRRFHAVSEEVATTMSARLHIPRDRIDVVPRGRDSATLGERSRDRRLGARAALGIADHTKVLVAIARHEYQKGLDVLVAAVDELRQDHDDLLLLVAGRSGAQTSSLLEETARHGLEGAVRFLGTHDDVPGLLCAADVFVFPSRWEGSPGAVIEAMALETPIVASDLPSIREVVADARGARLVPVEDHHEMARAIAQVLDSPGPTDDLRARFLSALTVEKSVDGMMKFYERALSGAMAPS
jgi:glycosyltransferase involved in cell wall biosynthesis